MTAIKKSTKQPTNALTDKEFKVIDATLRNEYIDGPPQPNYPTWVSVVSDYTFKGKTFSGIVGSLKKKGFILTTEDSRTSIQNIPDATIEVTQVGFEVWKSQAPAEHLPQGGPAEPVYEMPRNRDIKEQIKADQKAVYKAEGLEKDTNGAWSNYRTYAAPLDRNTEEDDKLAEQMYEVTKQFIHRRPRMKDYKGVIQVMSEEFPEVKRYGVFAESSWFADRLNAESYSGVDATTHVTTVTQ